MNAQKPLADDMSSEEDSDVTITSLNSDNGVISSPTLNSRSENLIKARGVACSGPVKPKKQSKYVKPPKQTKTGPSALKHICFSCQTLKWCTDYREASKSECGVKSICRFCISDKQNEVRKKEYEIVKKELLTLQQKLGDIRETMEQRLVSYRSKLEDLTISSQTHQIRIVDLENQNVELRTKLDRMHAEKAATTQPTSSSGTGKNNNNNNESNNNNNNSNQTQTDSSRDASRTSNHTQPDPPRKERETAGECFLRKFQEQAIREASTKASTPSCAWGANINTNTFTNTSRQPNVPMTTPGTRGVRGNQNTPKRNQYNSEGFRTISNRSRAPQATGPQLPLSTRNRYEAFGESSTQNNNLQSNQYELTNNLVGDLFVQGLGTHYTKLNPLNRITKSIPDAGLSTIRRTVSSMILDKRSSLIVCAGGNDLFLRKGRTGPTELFIANSAALIDTVKEKSHRGIIVGLVPRLNITSEAHSKATALNRRVEALCNAVDVRFVNPWDYFVNKRELFKRDGVHLNEIGSQKLADLINSRLYKNLEQPIKQGTTKTTNKYVSEAGNIHGYKAASSREERDVQHREPPDNTRLPNGSSACHKRNEQRRPKHSGTPVCKVDATRPGSTTKNPNDNKTNGHVFMNEAETSDSETEIQTTLGNSAGATNTNTAHRPDRPVNETSSIDTNSIPWWGSTTIAQRLARTVNAISPIDNNCISSRDNDSISSSDSDSISSSEINNIRNDPERGTGISGAEAPTTTGEIPDAENTIPLGEAPTNRNVAITTVSPNGDANPNSGGDVTDPDVDAETIISTGGAIISRNGANATDASNGDDADPNISRDVHDSDDIEDGEIYHDSLDGTTDLRDDNDSEENDRDPQPPPRGNQEPPRQGNESASEESNTT